MTKRNETGSGFEYCTMWAAYKKQPLHIRQEWMLGLKEPNGKRDEGFDYILRDVMTNFTKSVQDEVFEGAPEEIKRFYGYGQSERQVQKASVKPIISARSAEVLRKLLED